MRAAFRMFSIASCHKCAHYKPYKPNPDYDDLGKCALYKEHPSNRTGFAEGARMRPDLCGLKGNWFKAMDPPVKR